MVTDPLEGPQSTPLAPAGFEFNRPTIIGLLYLASALTGVTGIVGIVLCYLWKGEAHQPWEGTHYVYLARTFWIGLLACFVGALLAVIGIGLLIIAAAGIWALVRTVLSLAAAQKRAAMPDPQTLFF